MKTKWYLLSLMLMVLFVSVGAISAADNSNVSNMSEIVNSGNLDTSSNNANSIHEYSSNGASIEADVHVGTDDGSEVQSEISNSNNTVIYLDNQTFILNSTSDYGLCVDSNKNLTICGGYSIGDGKTSTLSAEKLATGIPTLFIKSNSAVTLININFINHNSTQYYDYALKNYGKLVLINCTFDNNTYSLLSYYGDTVLIDCTLINTSYRFQNVDESIIDNSNFRNSSIMWDGSINSTITNSVFDGGLNSAIIISGMRDRFSIDNCTFSNINSSRSGAAISYMQWYNTCILNITNSKFNNNSVSSLGGAISTFAKDDIVYLENCSFYNNSARNGGACYFNINATLKNCTFNNNSALSGGSIYSRYYLNSTNCSYDGNSALYGGAIYGYNSTVLINDSSFRENYALMAGGAVSSYLNNAVIDNSIFSNNAADVCGGAVVIGNSTETVIGNSNFTSNDGQDYGNDVYSYGSNLILNNNSISGVYNVSNDTLFVPSSDISNGFVVYLDNNTTGFCLEEYFDYPGSDDADSWYSGLYSIFNHTNIALNSLNYQKVGDYIKYIIVNYYGKVPNIVLNYAIWTFTDNNYTDSVNEDTIKNIRSIITGDKYHYGPPGISLNVLASTLLGDSLDYAQIAAEVSEIVNDALNAYNSGVRIPDHYVEVDENGTGTLYDFGSIFSNYYQNFITFKTSNYTVVYDIDITKLTNNPVVYRGNDTSFDIVVANNGTMTLSNVTVSEDSYDDLIYRSSSNITGNWTYSFVNGKHTWTLVGYLGVNQTARFNVVFGTSNSTLGNKTNTVSVTTNENATGNASNITEVIENNTPETPENNTPNTTENNTPNKPTPVDNKSVENNNTSKADVKTDEATGYPFIALIIALIGIIGTGFRKK